ncbi:precorrin-2 dehydrogenase/sirohydrochlorin ferrochelatase family protein [Paenibacillus sedimenti]|uniref:precorrin-2 dehydrogenase n=1 Tax=Paenibacillus sedimenti TaxID=2770274 RepID=A0A926KRQ0_9BACL|nr:bifunctional precorrin-2 dehydrogenase/sirohydrochlorin ferrochelatase [Paenibacillus sedimenti]MBD0381666.1 bifunctional precorrin-2 dehydrogenase/sirohydrochlorin ferrochelatase [Paenibacillus sedimenti]
MKHQYPIMLDVNGACCLIVGGGSIAERKARSLVQAGAHVTVVSPDFTAGLIDMERNGEVVLYRQTFSSLTISTEVAEGTTPYKLVIAATDAADVNKKIFEAAAQHSLLVNVVDQPELSTFIVPSVVRRGKLVIAVSTGGASPAAARKIARELEQTYGDEYELYLDFLSEVRLNVQAAVPDKEARQQLFKEMLEWDVLSRIRAGSFESWKQEMFEAFEKEPVMATIRAFGQRL